MTRDPTGSDVWLALVGSGLMGPQRHQNGGPSLLAHLHPRRLLCNVPPWGHQPLLPAVEPVLPNGTPVLCVLLQPDHRARRGTPGRPASLHPFTRRRPRRPHHSHQRLITWPTAVRLLSWPSSCELGPGRGGLPPSSPLPLMQTPALWLLPTEVPTEVPPPPSPGPHTHRVLRPSRPRNMPLRMDSSWLAVRCSSLTEAAPSKAPSSISDTLLLLRLLGEEVAGG